MVNIVCSLKIQESKCYKSQDDDIIAVEAHVAFCWTSGGRGKEVAIKVSKM